MRLGKLNKENIDKTFKEGKKLFSPYFVCYVAQKKSDQEDTKYLVIASRKVGNAVSRNRAKRLLRVVARNSLDLFEELNISSIIFIARSEITTANSNYLTDVFTKKVKKLLNYE